MQSPNIPIPQTSQPRRVPAVDAPLAAKSPDKLKTPEARVTPTANIIRGNTPRVL
jgi:hypothetical protein